MVQRVKRRERHRRQAEDEAAQLERDLDNYLEAGATPETLPDWLKEDLRETASGTNMKMRARRKR
jgi:hypothetical protein